MSGTQEGQELWGQVRKGRAILEFMLATVKNYEIFQKSRISDHAPEFLYFDISSYTIHVNFKLSPRR